MNTLDLNQVLHNSCLEIRGDGKAGSGLVLVVQSLAGLLMRDDKVHVQEWPFFSSARKGAAVRSFLRTSTQPIKITSEISNPHVSILMDEGASKFVDFAVGVREGGTYILNTTHSPQEAAKHYHLSGRVITVAGDALGMKYLKRPLGNISVYAVLVKAIGLNTTDASKALKDNLTKRRLPAPVIEANIELFNQSLNQMQEGTFQEAKPSDHQIPAFKGYGDLPNGAQTGLRISRGNKTASYARAGARVSFEDPNKSCTGCTLCITACPENIIKYQPDAKKGVAVTGADFATYCKYCRECVEICPEKLFTEKPYEELWEESR